MSDQRKNLKPGSSLTIALLLFLLLAILAPAAPAQQQQAPEASGPAAGPLAPQPLQQPAVAAKTAFMINADDGEVLYSKEPDVSLPMASTTKMMTALIVMENCQNLDDEVTISKRAAEVGESSIWLEEGEKLTVKQLLEGLLIQSGNDAAVALAEYQSGSVEAFVDLMNQRARELGLTQTHYTNPHGLDDPDHYTSARDLVTLGRKIMKYPEIRQIVATTEMAIPWPGRPYDRDLVSHNHLLWMSDTVTGIKTGYTDAAGQCIVVSATDRGIDLIVSYMGGPTLEERNQDILNLLQYGFDSYQERPVITNGQEYASVEVPYQREESMPLVSAGDLVKLVNIHDDVQYRTVLPDELTLPVSIGDKVGLVEAYDGDTYLGSSFLLATQDIPKPGWRDRASYFLDSVFHFLLSVALTG
jgi:D-alanyl-D-alanine carboxypeptidase (penicillin-binding protein 5/6)